MKVARTKAQLKHLKTKRKKAALKKKKRTERNREALLAAAGGMREVSMEDGVDADDGVDAEGEGNGTVGMTGMTTTTTSGRMKKSAVTNRKRELRERITDLKSKRSKIAKSNFAKRDERKALSEEIKRLERERAELAHGGGGAAAMMADGDDDGDEEMAM